METLLEGTPPVTERDMLDLLLARYNTERRGTIADRYVRAEHVRSSQHFYGISIADFIAIDKYATHQAIIGHEVKVSRSDWLAELKDLSKAERIKQYCDYWYLVVSDAAIVKPGELPEDWGLIVKAGTKLRAKVKAPKLMKMPLTLDFTAGLASAIQRTAMREPLRRDARAVWLWNERLQDALHVCQACGELAPCALHQPRTAAA